MEAKQSTGKTKYVNRVLSHKIYSALKERVTRDNSEAYHVVNRATQLVDRFSMTGDIDEILLTNLTISCAFAAAEINGKGVFEAALFGIAEIRRYNIDEIKKYDEKVMWDGVKLRDFVDPILRHAIPITDQGMDSLDDESKLPHIYALLFYCMVLLNWSDVCNTEE